MNYLVSSRILEGWTKNDRNRFFHHVKFFVWNDPYLFKYCSDQAFRRCIQDHKAESILSFYHDQASGGHFSGRNTAAKVLQCDFYWPTLFRDAFEYCKTCPRWQLFSKVSRSDMMPLNFIIVVEIFDV